MTDTSLIGNRAAGYVNVYPNPAFNNFKIQVGQLEAGATVQLYDRVGVLVHSERLIDRIQVVSVKDLSRGIYIVMVRNGDQVTTRKIVIQ
jgi:hypothetical protein